MNSIKIQICSGLKKGQENNSIVYIRWILLSNGKKPSQTQFAMEGYISVSVAIAGFMVLKL